MLKYLLILLSTNQLLAQHKSLKNNPMDNQTITILQSADIHAYLNSHDELFVENGKPVFRKAGGLAHMKTLVEQIKKENPEGTLFIDGGDLIQGSGASVKTKGSFFPDIVKVMNYDVLIPGNWEVIYGKEVMMKVMNAYETQVIAANMFHEDSGKPLFPTHWVTERKGVKMAFIAYNDPEIPERQNPTYSEGITFTPVKFNLQRLVRQMKEEEKVDLVFVVAHIGLAKQVSLANSPEANGVDFIFGNDTHERVRKPIEGKYSRVVEPGAFGSFLGKLEVQVRDHKMVDYSYELVEVSPEIFSADKQVQAVIDQALQPYQKEMDVVLGYTATPLYRYLVVENPMDNLITDALLWKTGVDFATSNGFRFGVPILPDETGKKAITKGDLWRMLPVDENMKTGTVTGSQIKEWLEKEIENVFSEDYEKRFGGWLVRFSGMTLKFDSSKANGNRISEITIQGRPLEPEREYRMASCNRTGEPLSTMCRMKSAKDVTIQSYSLHDAVEEYLKSHGTVSPKIDGRSVATDLGPQSYSEMKEVGYRFE